MGCLAQKSRAHDTSDYARFLEVAFHRLNPGSLSAVPFSLPSHRRDKSLLAIPNNNKCYYCFFPRFCLLVGIACGHFREPGARVGR